MGSPLYFSANKGSVISLCLFANIQINLLTHRMLLCISNPVIFVLSNGSAKWNLMGQQNERCRTNQKADRKSLQ